MDKLIDGVAADLYIANQDVNTQTYILHVHVGVAI